MKTLTATERHELAGPYFAPEGLYEYTKSLPFVGKVWSDAQTLVAGEWTEIVINYEVGASGLADGAWIKGTFKFYSVCDGKKRPSDRLPTVRPSTFLALPGS